MSLITTESLQTGNYAYMNEACHLFRLWPAGYTNLVDLEALRDLYMEKHRSEVPCF